jgi:hypothetical protein
MIEIRTGDDLNYMTGALLRLWSYYSSHDQLFLMIRLNDTYGTLHMVGCRAIKMPTGCVLEAPVLLPHPDSPSTIFCFSDEASGIEIICNSVWLDTENEPDDYRRLRGIG